MAGLLQSAIQSISIPATGLSQLRATTTATAAALGDRADEYAGMLTFDDHSPAKGCIQNHLALPMKARQSTNDYR